MAAPFNFEAKDRRYQRFPLDVPLFLLVAKSVRPIRGRTVVISETGMSALLVADLPVEAIVKLEFALPPRTDTPIRLHAIVRNRVGTRHGFEFLTLTAEQRCQIRHLCLAMQ